jgi:hypothetical protein
MIRDGRIWNWGRNQVSLAVRNTTKISLLCIMMLLSACAALAPTNTPPHLDYTPGPPVVITDQTYDAGPFSLRYPPGWRVITAAAFSTPWVVLITPDETALIVLALDEQDTEVVPANTAASDLRRLDQVLPLSTGQSLYAVLIAPQSEWQTFMPIFDRVTTSITTPSDS